MKNSEDKKQEIIDDTFSITMELERPLLGNDENHNIEPKKPIKSKKLRNVLIGIIILFILAVIGWSLTCYEAGENAQNALISDENVEVSGVDSDIITFTPKNIEAKKGFILYQGAKVDAKAYANLARQISENGYFVALLDIPLDFAMLSLNKADKVIDKYENIEKWAVGGHSLGGVVASMYALENSDDVSGLVLLASYPMDEELKDMDIKTTSIWGSVDGVLDYEELLNTKSHLPVDTTYVEIEGANHAQFGDYGKQTGDNDAIISFEEQIDITSKSIIDLLGEI